MSRTIERAVLSLLVILLLVVAVGIGGCASRDTDEPSSSTAPTDGGQEGPISSESDQDDAILDESELREDAMGFAYGLLEERGGEVAPGEFDIAVEGIAEDTERNVWAHVIATPPSTAMLEANHFWLLLVPFEPTWELVTEGTDVDPGLFPEDVWSKIGYGPAADGGTSELPTTQPISPESAKYAEDLGGTSQEGESLFVVVGASTESESDAQAALEAAIPSFGDMQSYFVVQSADNFDGLDPGWWVVIEAYRNEPSQENLDFARRAFPDAYVVQVKVATSDPIPVYEDIVGE